MLFAAVHEPGSGTRLMDRADVTSAMGWIPEVHRKSGQRRQWPKPWFGVNAEPSISGGSDVRRLSRSRPQTDGITKYRKRVI